MGCGCGGGGGGVAPLITGGSNGVGSASGGASSGGWRVSWMDSTTMTQQSRDWPTQMEAFAHAGIVGGTISLAPTG